VLAFVSGRLGQRRLKAVGHWSRRETHRIRLRSRRTEGGAMAWFSSTVVKSLNKGSEGKERGREGGNQPRE